MVMVAGGRRWPAGRERGPSERRERAKAIEGERGLRHHVPAKTSSPSHMFPPKMRINSRRN